MSSGAETLVLPGLPPIIYLTAIGSEYSQSPRIKTAISLQPYVHPPDCRSCMGQLRLSPSYIDIRKTPTNHL